MAAVISTKVAAVLFITNLLFFTAFSAPTTDCNCGKKSPPKPPAPVPAPKPPAPVVKPPPTPVTKPPPAPVAKPPASPPPPAKCPKDTLKLGACADLLGGLVHVVIGTPPASKCCAVLEGLVDLEAALCLCTVIKAKVLGINLTVPVALSLLLSACEKTVPPGFKC